MITDLYRKYFQKSYTFVYPWLRIRNNVGSFAPVQTYTTWKGLYVPQDYKLICEYGGNPSDPNWREFQRKHLLSHRNLENVAELPEYPRADMVPDHDPPTSYFIFDMSEFKEDFDHFVEGRYSKFSQSARKMLNDYYGVTSPQWAYIDSFINPGKYFKDYAKILNVDEGLLREVGELCEKPHGPSEELEEPIPEHLLPNIQNL